MRKPRDFDAELKALNERAKSLKDRKVKQLGELVIATGADGLDLDSLAGALLAVISEKNLERREAYRQSGATFFRRSERGQGNDGVTPNPSSNPETGGTQEPFKLRSCED